MVPVVLANAFTATGDVTDDPAAGLQTTIPTEVGAWHWGAALPTVMFTVFVIRTLLSALRATKVRVYEPEARGTCAFMLEEEVDTTFTPLAQSSKRYRVL